ncbi:hypothetical protein [Sandarakinorhabdus rubra]|uniref:hypothetical protein n=1 Tax=Sandarakinorhabdus rubra TaxID=2672568 RepID=UPI0013DBBF18|nr:hypothetical protein [Sandarakinorhabdus rubra]
MGAAGWRAWSIVVQAAAFVGAANILTPLLLVVFELGSPVGDPSLLRKSTAFVLGGLMAFGAVPYMLAGPRFGRWRIAALTGLLPGLLLGVFAALASLGSQSDVDTFATSGALFLFFAGLGLTSALLVRALVPADLFDDSRNPARPNWRDALPLVAAASVMATIPLDEERAVAPGCLESPRSAVAVTDFYLRVPEDQLKALATTLSSHANDNGWSVHGTVRETKDHLFFAQVICLKRGLEVGLERDLSLSNNRLRIIVFAQDADIAWQADVRNLLMILGHAGQVTRRPDRTIKAPPAWYLAIPEEPRSPAILPSEASPATH